MNPWSDWEPVTADLFILGHAYLAIAASLSLAVIVGTFFYARNEKRNGRHQ